MSVDYYSCDCCEESVYEEFVKHCEKCGHNICTECVVNDDIDSEYASRYRIKFDGSDEQKEEYGITQENIDNGYFKIGEPIQDTVIDPKYCPFCNCEMIHNDDLLDYLLNKYNLSKDKIKREYLGRKEIVK